MLTATATCTTCAPLTCTTHAARLFSNVERTRLDYFAAERAMKEAEQRVRDYQSAHKLTNQEFLAEFDHAETKQGRPACEVGASALAMAFNLKREKQIYVVHGSGAHAKCKVYRLHTGA